MQSILGRRATFSSERQSSGTLESQVHLHHHIFLCPRKMVKAWFMPDISEGDDCRKVREGWLHELGLVSSSAA